jgi:hypothetical protein
MKIYRSRSTDGVTQATLIAVFGCVAVAASTLLAGCNSASATDERGDYSTTLNRYYEGRPMCLWTKSVSFPVAASAAGQPDQRGLDALVDTGLLSRQRVGKNGSPSSYTYDLTKEGYSALDRDIDHPSTGNFCYGRRTVVGVDADRQHSSTTELIDFRYTVPQPASWAMELSIQRAFPQVVDELSGPHKAEAILLDTTEGWEVSATPATIASSTPPLPSATFARAKALLHINKKQRS